MALAALALSAPPAAAQTIAYEAGSIYDLDPPANQATGNRILEQVAGSNDMEPVRELGPGDVYRKLARPVGRFAYALADGRPRFCTASLIADDLIITNHHCIEGAEEALLWMGYLQARSREGVAQYPVVLPPLEADKSLDYAILKVRGTPGREWGKVTLAPAALHGRQSLFVVHHPGGFEKHITLGGCRASDPAEDGDDLLHHCDTMGGSSGAPIFDVASRQVVGLHYSAVALKGLNAGKRMARLMEASTRLAALAPKAETRAPAAPQAPAQPPLSPAALEWQSVQATTSCAVLESFQEAHGASPFARYATARQRELKCGEEKVAVGTFSPGVQQPATGRESTGATDCDRLAGQPLDVRTRALGLKGVSIQEINSPQAIAACGEAMAAYPDEHRFQFQLGRALHSGGHHTEAVRWFRKAAEAGDAWAKTALGAVYQNGQGVAKDEAHAVRLYREAAGAGISWSMTNLGFMYATGRGVADLPPFFGPPVI